MLRLRTVDEQNRKAPQPFRHFQIWLLHSCFCAYDACDALDIPTSEEFQCHLRRGNKWERRVTYCPIKQSQSEYQIRQLDVLMMERLGRSGRHVSNLGMNGRSDWMDRSNRLLRPAAIRKRNCLAGDFSSAKGRAGQENMSRKTLHRNEANENYSNVVCLMRTQFIKISSEIIVMSI